MTRNGIAYRRSPLVPLRDATGLSLLPSPTEKDSAGSRNATSSRKPGSTPPRRRHVNGLDLVEDGPWSAFPEFCRVDYGLPGTVDRLSALGNSFIPQIPEAIGRAILAAQEAIGDVT